MNWLNGSLSKYIYNEKDKQVLKNMLAAFVIKGGSLFITLFTMPAYIKYFDNQIVLGLWFTILSVMSWILSCDFGIGNGLRNRLVEAIVNKNKRDIKTYVSSAYIIIFGIVLIVLIIGFLISNFINWNFVFNISKEIISKDTLLFSIKCVFAGIMLQFLLGLISSILYSMQKSAIINLLSLTTSILQLIYILIIPRFDIETNLRMLSLAYVICVNTPLFITTIIVFKTSLKNCAPSIRYFNKNKAGMILSLGGVFFWNQIMYMIISTTNEFFIAKFSGPQYVVEYQIYNKLFTLVGLLFMLALTPMWSIITKAINEGDLPWLSKTYKLLNYMVLIAVGCQILLIPFLQIIINIWLGKNAIIVNYVNAIIFAAFGSIFIYQSALSTIVCGMGKMKLQAICYTGAVILKFIIIYFGMKIYSNWIVVILTNILILIPYCLLQPREIKKSIYEL